MDQPKETESILEPVLRVGNRAFWAAVFNATPNGLYIGSLIFHAALPTAGNRAYFLARTGRRLGNHLEVIMFRCRADLLPVVLKDGTRIEIVGSLYSVENDWGIDVEYLQKATRRMSPYKRFIQFQDKLLSLMPPGSDEL